MSNADDSIIQLKQVFEASPAIKQTTVAAHPARPTFVWRRLRNQSKQLIGMCPDDACWPFYVCKWGWYLSSRSGLPDQKVTDKIAENLKTAGMSVGSQQRCQGKRRALDHLCTARERYTKQKRGRQRAPFLLLHPSAKSIVVQSESVEFKLRSSS